MVDKLWCDSECVAQYLKLVFSIIPDMDVAAGRAGLSKISLQVSVEL